MRNRDPVELEGSAPPRRGDTALATPPIRIVAVITALGAGGSERVITFLVNHWAEEGHDVTLVTFESPVTRPYYTLDPRVTLRPLDLVRVPKPWWRGVVQSLRRVAALRRVLGATRPHVVFSFLTKTNVLTLLATDPSTTPVIISERSVPALQPFGPIWTRLRARLYPRAFSLVTMTEQALADFPPEQRPRGRAIPNAIAVPRGLRPHRDGRTVVAVGRLVAVKGFDLLLEAFARVAPAHPEWRLVIWGEGELRGSLERQRDALGLAGRVELPGVSPQPGGWVATGDVFVLSSRFEGWGLALAEAMAAGLPVAAFDCPVGPAQMIRDGADGLLVPPEAVGALAAALDRLLSDADLRARLAGAGRKSAARFAPERVLMQWDEVLAEAAHASISTRTSAPLRREHLSRQGHQGNEV